MPTSLPHAVTLTIEDAPCLDDPNNNVCRWVHDWTKNDTAAEVADWVLAKPLAIVGLILLGWFARWGAHKLIDRLADRASQGPVPGVLQRGKMQQKLLEANRHAVERRSQRAGAMGSLLKSIATGLIGAVIAFMVIAQLGYNIAPLIASAGILGVAFGFGAQSLVKDFLSGIFMILEDQYGVGDVVDLGEAEGTVESVGLRVTRLRDVNGTVWYVRNGEILRVGNQSQNWARTVLDIPVDYGEDLTRVREVLHEVATALWLDPAWGGYILEEPEVWGVERWDPDGVVVRVVLKTAPLKQWEVAREMRELIKDRFDHLGIVIPLQQRVVHFQGDLPVPDEGRSNGHADVAPSSPSVAPRPDAEPTGGPAPTAQADDR